MGNQSWGADDKYALRGRATAAHSVTRQLILLLLGGLLIGYFLGMILMETADSIFTIGAEHHHGQAIVAPAISHQDVGTSTLGTSAGSLDEAVSHTSVTTTATTASSTGSQKESGAAAGTPSKHGGHTIHSLLTSNGSPYQNFQGRIMYGTYKLVQKMPGGEMLTGFTRIMHRMTNDAVMDEIPTFRATPLHPECDVYCDFPVADRPNAVQQWITAVDKDPSMLKGAWVLLLECDYVWMKPLQAPNAYTDQPGYQFHFDYIIPTWKGVTETLTRLMKAYDLHVPDNVAIPPSGPAPALLRFWELKQVTPAWELMTAAIEADKEAVKLMGWVREMYAWDVGVVASNVHMLTEGPGKSQLLAQPPHDQTLGLASICHYTWGATYNDSQGEVFKWEKRDYTSAENALKVPHIPMPPQPFVPNKWHLQDGLPVTQELHETLTAMLGQMNKAINLLPDLTPKA